jgi:gluconokinase
MSMAASRFLSDAPVLVVMGVAGAGKTTVGRQLADRLGLAFIEGDDLHPSANVAKMSAGQPLADEDRWPWLERIAARLREARQDGSGAVVACSALKRSYRDRLRRAAPGLLFVHLAGSRQMLAERLAARVGHFMPAALLDTQLSTLEAPGGESGVMEVGIGEPIGRICDRIEAALAR